ncbi:MAG: hypothetical protein IJ371_05950 [Clostridia bacterium]|nr:hypothetical protein [Clostridia bacterium]
MNILDLIKKSATILNIHQILDDSSLEDVTVDNEASILAKNSELKRVFELAKVVIEEASAHSKNLTSSTIYTYNQKINMYSYDYIDKVVDVQDENGVSVEYEIDNGNIRFKQDGKYTIIYYRNPYSNSLLSYIDMHRYNINEALLVNGLNAYYCLSVGLADEYNEYNNKYLELLSHVKNLKIFAMPCRSWHG